LGEILFEVLDGLFDEGYDIESSINFVSKFHLIVTKRSELRRMIIKGEYNKLDDQTSED
jgi:hypothetical protein